MLDFSRFAELDGWNRRVFPVLGRRSLKVNTLDANRVLKRCIMPDISKIEIEVQLELSFRGARNHLGSEFH